MGSQNKGLGKRGRPAWKPPNLDVVRGLASQGMTMDTIAAVLGISPSTLYKKKREFVDFAKAIERGAAEGEAVATSKLFEAVKRDEPWAIQLYLKTRCGWGGNDGGNFNINIGLHSAREQAEAKRIEEQKKLIRLLSVREREQYLELMSKAAERQHQQEQAVEVRARPQEESDG